MDYDPNGRSENANAVLNPLDALEAKEAADEAVELTKEAFPNIRRAWNNEADAFRHAAWNYLMTKKVGADAAKEFGDAHERYSGNALGETTMDLYNNNVGRALGSNPNFKAKDAKRVILRAIRQGKLRTKPFEITGGGANVETDY